MKRISGLIFALTAFFLASENAFSQTPSFTLAWSEYPSWSTFGVAHEVKLINGKRGELGPIEKKWGVDIVLQEMDYDPCLVSYGAGQSDAVCITNMDVLSPSVKRASVAVCPTSTSLGADALLVLSSVTKIQDLKGKPVHGLAKTVSEYMFVRNLEILGENESDYKFTNMDPGAAATAMQQKKLDAIVVWNPFVLQTLAVRKDVRVLFDSTTIPGEIVDMLVVSQASLEKPGGEAFACAAIDTYYAINLRLADPKTRDDTLLALGEKFSHLNLQAMRKVVQQTRFYSTPEEGVKLFTSDEFKEINKRVVAFCASHEIVDSKPEVGYGDKRAAPKAALRFDSGYMKEVMKKK